MCSALWCDGVRFDGITSVWKWLPPALWTPPHSASLLHQEEPRFPISNPQFVFQLLLFLRSLHLCTHTSNPFSMSKATAVWLFIWQWDWMELAMLPQRDGSVSGWWLRSPAASLPRAGNSNLIRAKTPPFLLHLPERCTRVRPKPNRMGETKAKV